MRWPWQREKREANSYTDGRVLASLRDAEGAGATVHETAALEAAAGLYAFCMAGAVVSPSHPALTPACLSLLARDLIRNGESLFQIRLAGDRVQLLPAASWDVRGGLTPESWFYRVDIFGPTADTPTSQIVSGAQVLHFMYSTSAARPWFGVGPLSWARESARLAGGLENKLSGEAQGPSGYLLPIPQDGGNGGDDDPNKTLKSDLQKADGKTTLVETTSAGWGEGRGAAPMQDWQAKRYGIDIPGPNIDLRNAAVMSVLNACQIPLALFSDADGTSQRESWRRFAMGPLAGLARIIESEISDKLMVTVKFDFSGLWAHDIQGRAQAFNRLVQGGMSIEKAAGASGVLMDS